MSRKQGKGKIVATKPPVNRGPSGQPKAWVPTWEVPVILKGADLAMKGGEKLAEWIRSEGPLCFQVLDSRADGDNYLVELRATNMTVHGIYLDSFNLVSPIQLGLPIVPKVIKPISIGGSDSLGDRFPKPSKPIRPGFSMDFSIEFPVPKPEDLRKGWFRSDERFGSAEVKYWILNEKSVRSQDVTFSIPLT